MKLDTSIAGTGGPARGDRVTSRWMRCGPFWRSIRPIRRRFCVTHILYYLGGLIAIGAMTLFHDPGLGAVRRLGLFLSPLPCAAAGCG